MCKVLLSDILCSFCVLVPLILEASVHFLNLQLEWVLLYRKLLQIHVIVEYFFHLLICALFKSLLLICAK
jgi:hypothetical protein